MHIIPQNKTTLPPHEYATLTFPWHLHETVCARARNIIYHSYSGESEWVVARGRREMRLCELRIYFVVVVLDNGGEIDIETRPISTRKENEKNLKQFSRLPRSLYTYTQFSRGPRFLLFCAEVNREADRVPSRFECGTRCQFFLIPPFVPLPFVLMYLTVATLPHIRYHWVSGGGREFCKRVGDVHKYLTTT